MKLTKWCLLVWTDWASGLTSGLILRAGPETTFTHESALPLFCAVFRNKLLFYWPNCLSDLIWYLDRSGKRWAKSLNGTYHEIDRRRVLRGTKKKRSQRTKLESLSIDRERELSIYSPSISDIIFYQCFSMLLLPILFSFNLPGLSSGVE